MCGLYINQNSQRLNYRLTSGTLASADNINAQFACTNEAKFYDDLRTKIINYVGLSSGFPVSVEKIFGNDLASLVKILLGKEIKYCKNNLNKIDILK